MPLMITLEGITELMLTFMRNNLHLTALIVFSLGFAESIALVSLFVPSTILFLAIGGLHSAAGGQFLPVWLAGAAGATLGDLASYSIGRTFQHDVHRIWPFTRMPGLIPQGRAMFERWGVWSIVAGKFVGGLRPFIPVVAGMLQMPWAVFLIGSALSSLVWAGIFLAPGYSLAMAPR